MHAIVRQRTLRYHAASQDTRDHREGDEPRKVDCKLDAGAPEPARQGIGKPAPLRLQEKSREPVNSETGDCPDKTNRERKPRNLQPAISFRADFFGPRSEQTAEVGNAANPEGDAVLKSIHHLPGGGWQSVRAAITRGWRIDALFDARRHCPIHSAETATDASAHRPAARHPISGCRSMQQPGGTRYDPRLSDKDGQSDITCRVIRIIAA
ncbi:hypothetical protein ACFFJ7_18120 [Pseudochelatococcus lubricantis]|uniref:hypothetical protein n=1 Tax=Pseudochelatococcus lubricantis TaxID=1538102 RepID=UPI0035ED5B01